MNQKLESDVHNLEVRVKSLNDDLTKMDCVDDNGFDKIQWRGWVSYDSQEIKMACQEHDESVVDDLKTTKIEALNLDDMKIDENFNITGSGIDDDYGEFSIKGKCQDSFGEIVEKKGGDKGLAIVSFQVSYKKGGVKTFEGVLENWGLIIGTWSFSENDSVVIHKGKFCIEAVLEEWKGLLQKEADSDFIGRAGIFLGKVRIGLSIKQNKLYGLGVDEIGFFVIKGLYNK